MTFSIFRVLVYCMYYISIESEKKSESCSVMSDSETPWDPHIVNGILQARILEWVAFPFSRVPSQSRDQTQVSCIAGDSLSAEPIIYLINIIIQYIIYHHNQF